MGEWKVTTFRKDGTRRVSYWRNMFREDMEDIADEMTENDDTIIAIDIERMPDAD